MVLNGMMPIEEAHQRVIGNPNERYDIRVSLLSADKSGFVVANCLSPDSIPNSNIKLRLSIVASPAGLEILRCLPELEANEIPPIALAGPKYELVKLPRP